MPQKFEGSLDRIFLSVRLAIPERISIDECAELTGASKELIERLLDEEVLPISQAQVNDRAFDRSQFETLERTLRLHQELGVNIAGIVIIESLLRQLHEAASRRATEGDAIDASFE